MKAKKKTTGRKIQMMSKIREVAGTYGEWKENIAYGTICKIFSKNDK